MQHLLQIPRDGTSEIWEGNSDYNGCPEQTGFGTYKDEILVNVRVQGSLSFLGPYLQDPASIVLHMDNGGETLHPEKGGTQLS